MERKKLISIKISTLLLIILLIILILIGILFFMQHINKESDTDQINNNSITNQNTTNSISSENTFYNPNNNQSIISTKYNEITSNLDDIDVLFVTDALYNGDNTYTLQGVIYSQYTLNENEFNEVVFDKQLEVNNEFLSLKTYNSEYFLTDNSDNVLYNIIKNEDNTYHLESTSENNNVWKLTDNYMEITVSSDIPCYSVDDNSTTSVSEHFNNYSSDLPTNTTSPNSKYCYKFNFEDGICTEIINGLSF